MPPGRLTHDVALAIVRHVASEAPGAVSVVVADDHGEIVASLRMDGAALDTVQGVRPGMTGLWQVSGRNDLPYEVRVELDERYAAHHSFGWDLRILARTADAVIRGRGAY